MYQNPMAQGAAALNIDEKLLWDHFEEFYEDERGGDWTATKENYIDAYTEMALRVGYESEANWYVEA